MAGSCLEIQGAGLLHVAAPLALGEHVVACVRCAAATIDNYQAAPPMAVSALSRIIHTAANKLARNEFADFHIVFAYVSPLSSGLGHLAQLSPPRWSLLVDKSHASGVRRAYQNKSTSLSSSVRICMLTHHLQRQIALCVHPTHLRLARRSCSYDLNMRCACACTLPTSRCNKHVSDVLNGSHMFSTGFTVN